MEHRENSSRKIKIGITYQIVFSLNLIAFGYGSNYHSSNLFFQNDQIYTQYNLSNIIIPTRFSPICAKLSKLASHLEAISKLPIILESKSRTRFIKGALKQISELDNRAQSILSLIQPNQLNNDFTKRSLLKDIITTGIDILTPITDIPLFQSATKFVLRNLEKRWNEAPRIQAKIHKVLTQVHGNISSINDRLNLQKIEINKGQLDRNFIKLESSTRHMVATARKFLENIQKLTVHSLLPDQMVTLSDLSKSLEYLKRTLTNKQMLAVKEVKDLFKVPAILIRKKGEYYIVLTIPVVKVEDRKDMYTLKNKYIAARHSTGLKTAIITGVDTGKPFIIQQDKVNDEIILIHQLHCHQFAPNLKVCKFTLTETMGGKKCLPQIVLASRASLL